MRLLPVCLVVAALIAGCADPRIEIDPLVLAEDVRGEASDELVAALAEGAAVRRARAALAMGRIQSASYAAALAASAQDGPRELRLAALFATGQLGLLEGARISPASVEACRACLADPDPGIVARAVEALGKLATADVPAAVVPMLEHDDPGVRAQAAHALFRFRFAPTWRREADTPPELGDAAVRALARALGDSDVDVRRAAAHGLSRFGEPREVDALVAALADDDALVRLFSVRALGRSADPEANDAVARLFGDEDAQVRDEAIRALRALDPQAALPASLDDDPSHHVRASTAATVKDPARLERFLEDPSVAVRVAAAANAPERYVADADWRLRSAAAADAELAVRLLDDEDSRVVTAAMQAVAGRDDAARLIESAFVSDDLAIRGTAVTLVGDVELDDPVATLRRAYDASPGDDWIEVRESIVDALADLPDGATMLRDILDSDDAPSVRRRAAGALEVDPPPAAPARPSSWLGAELPDAPIVELETTKGTLVIRCFEKDAPVHVAAFLDRVSTGFYDGLSWHRVVPNFVIQGGDPRGDGWGTGGEPLRDEINRRPFVRGAVGMPKAGKDTGGCQIFITHLPTPHLDGNYTVYGQVIEGLDVIDRIEVGDRIVRASIR